MQLLMILYNASGGVHAFRPAHFLSVAYLSPVVMLLDVYICFEWCINACVVTLIQAYDL
jgi:hypothetical protein